MARDNHEPDDWMKNLFSTNGLLLIIIVLGVYWVFFSDDPQSEQTLYHRADLPIGVSESFNQAAIDRLGLDLTENLDPKLIPGLLTDAVRETAQEKVGEQEFLPTLVQRISNKIRDISTIDLNEDGVADPILVVPQKESSGADHLVFSILVPDATQVPNLPAGSDQNAWRDIAENKSIELMTASVVRGSEEQLTMQSTPNPQMYHSGGASYPPYYHHSPSLSSIFLTSMAGSMMANWMFMPRYGMGFGYYNPSPVAVSSVRQTRSQSVSSYGKAKPSSSAARTAGGKSVTANKFRSTSKKSMNNIKTTRYRASNKRAGTGGFGRTRATTRRAPAVSRRAPTSSRRLLRTPMRRSFGGFGRRSFGGFGRRR